MCLIFYSVLTFEVVMRHFVIVVTDLQLAGQRTAPLRIALIAPPGTGKSQCIHWIVRYFNDVLLWQMGVQFQTLAAQNSMAALIDGTTLHSWGCVPAMSGGDATYGTDGADVAKMYLHCAQMRWLVIDEVSSAALQVLGIVERNCRQALARNAWGTDCRKTQRLFGGLNVILVGDYQQLPPVAEKAIFSNPFSESASFTGPEARVLRSLWGFDEEKIPSVPEACVVLYEQHRAQDKWQRHVLEELRNSSESWETYCFTHGLPTIDMLGLGCPRRLCLSVAENIARTQLPK